MDSVSGEPNVREIVWEERHLGTMSWSSREGAYMLRVQRHDDLPLSFDVWTKVGHETVPLAQNEEGT